MSISHRRCLVSILLLSLAGLGLSIWLTVIHVRAHLDPFYESACAFGGRFNCDTVAASPYSVVAGIPVSVTGIVFYLVVTFVAAAALVDRKGEAHASLLALFATCGAVGSAALGIVSVWIIDSICLVCAATYLVNFFMFICAGSRVRISGGWRACAVREARELLRKRWLAVYAAAILVMLLWAGPGGGFPRYYEMAAWRQGVSLPHGIDRDGRPWMGATSPTLVVHEYFDFDCPACRLSHKKLRRILYSHPDLLRVVRHDTSRTPCAASGGKSEPWQCASAKVAYCALLSDRYWEWNDAVMARPKPRAAFGRLDYEWSMARRLGLDVVELERCVKDPSTVRVVQESYLDAKRANVRVTPTYLVSGTRLTLREVQERLSSSHPRSGCFG